MDDRCLRCCCCSRYSESGTRGYGGTLLHGCGVLRHPQPLGHRRDAMNDFGLVELHRRDRRDRSTHDLLSPGPGPRQRCHGR